MAKTIKQKPKPLLEFAARVREERHKLGLSQEAFAIRVGVHRTYIGMVERAEQNITFRTFLLSLSPRRCNCPLHLRGASESEKVLTLLNIEKIAKALKVPISELLQ